MSARVPAIVLGASGYVGAEMLRLIAGHPKLDVAAAVSRSATHAVADDYPHLAPALGTLRYGPLGEALAAVDGESDVAIFSAAPHGASAAMVDAVLDGRPPGWRVVDASADFRFADGEAYAAVYGQPHGAPRRLAEFVSALPEHLADTPDGHIGHPGCFASAMLLGLVPLVDLGLIDGPICATGITGSTGSGKSPLATTHHPERHSNLYAYKALRHRHAPEVVAITEARTNQSVSLRFVPHSGPFARGIHMTLVADAADGLDDAAALQGLERFYRDAPFVQVCATPPRLKDVVASNHARMTASVAEGAVVVTIVIDNLVKGAAGGSVQWMNRLLGFDETDGLGAVAPGFG